MAVADSHVLDSMQGLRYIKPFHHCPEQSKKGEKKKHIQSKMESRISIPVNRLIQQPVLSKSSSYS